ncbi:hypothetical protein [Aequorivita sp. CIP111184]|uniref:hypothetical protein n=1 Tax=Aequorivita sp. CIP111184 TaxID=2211356 RepID=UPI000DD043AA|nr:hypothetical protein [Aequorivita sp. CIP111184]
MKNLFLLIIFATSTFTYSQIEERKGKLFFKIGSEYRITPLPYDGSKIDQKIPADIDVQNSGVAFHYGFDYFITKNLSFGFNNSFRYDVLIRNVNEIDQENGFQKTDKTLIVGGHLYLDYHVKVFKNSELFARVGPSLLNGGTEYMNKTTFYDNQGNILGSSFSNETLEFFATNIAIGYKRQKVELLVGLYSSSTSNYFDETESLKIPYINITYTIGKMWK